MKRIKYFIYILLLTILLIPSYVKAFTRLDASTQSPVVGADVYVGINMNYGSDRYMKEVHLQAIFDNSYLKFEEIQWTQSAGTYTTENGRVYINKDSTTSFWDNGTVVAYIKFRVLKEGASSVILEQTANCYFHDGNIIPHEDKSTVTIIGKAPSSSTKIKSLTVIGYPIVPVFSPESSNKTYTVEVPADTSAITIKVEKGDPKQTITGDGEQKLNYGLNKLKIEVKAQNGDTNVYELHVTRKDIRTGDVSLKELTITNTDIKYIKDQYEYSVVVSRSIDSVLISARTNDPNANLTGTGEKKLNIGSNVFILNVESSGGKKQEYVIKIIRSEEEFQSKTCSNKLISLNINGLVMDLTGNKDKFLVGVSSDTNELNISAVTESKTAEVTIEGNEKFETGLNLVTVKVTEKDETSSTYTIVVYKNPNAAEVTDLNNAEFDVPTLYASTNTNINLTKEMINKINNNKTTLYFNAVNMHGGLLYQVALHDNLTDEFNLALTKTSQTPLTYQSNIPAGNEILIYLDDIYKDGNTIKIYSYNEAGKYTLVTDGIKVEKGYVSFISNGANFYVFTTTALIKEESPITMFINNYLGMIIGVSAGIAIIVFLVNYIKKKKQPTNNEPLY